MFLFTTTTLINNSDSFKVIYKSDGKTVVGCRAIDGPAFKLADKACITVYKSLYEAEKVDSAEIDLSGCTDTDTTYRLSIYVRSQGNADPMFANDFVFKGKPFNIEFAGSATAAKTVAKLAADYQLALYDMKQLDITADTAGTKLTVEGINGFQRLFRIAIESWKDAKPQQLDYSYQGSWTMIDLVDGTTAIASGKKTSEGGKIVVTVGNEGKGTYEQVLSDLRLPTGDNFAYLNVNAPEMPILGGKYNQYTIYLRKELKGYPGGIGINNPVESITTHVFFVESGAVSAFETALKAGTGYDFTTVTEATFDTKDTNSDKAVAGSSDTDVNEL